MTLFIGVDIAKETHYAAMTNQHGEILVESFPFDNSKSGFDLFLNKFKPYLSKNDEKVIVGFESTAHYASNFSHFLDQNSISYQIINPLETSAERKGNIRRTKTDAIDAILISGVLCKRVNKKKIIMNRSEFYSDLYSLCTCRHNLVVMRSKSKIQLVAYMDRVFPELAGFFSGNLQLNTVYKLVLKYPTPDSIKKVRIDTLTTLLEEASHGRFKKEKAVELKELAKKSVGIPSSSFALQAQLAVNQIELYTEQIKSIEEEIKEVVSSIDTPLKSIPGLNSYELAVFLSVTDNLTNFDSPSKVIAYAGLDPIVNESGKWKANATRMSKRGNSLLRYRLIWAANNVRLNNATFAAYYQKKIDEGKSHYNALGHCAAKLVRIMFKLVQDNVTFNLD